MGKEIDKEILMTPGKSKTILILLAAATLTGASAVTSFAETGPDIVVLESLAKYYEPVNFDHAMHVEMTEQKCSICHHHTTGQAPENERCMKCHEGGREADSMACSECHAEKRFDAAYLANMAANKNLFHVDKPGLKGAYHQNCMGCHKEIGAPIDCQGCHARTDAGDAFFSSGKYAPAPAPHDSGH